MNRFFIFFINAVIAFGILFAGHLFLGTPRWQSLSDLNSSIITTNELFFLLSLILWAVFLFLSVYLLFSGLRQIRQDFKILKHKRTQGIIILLIGVGIFSAGLYNRIYHTENICCGTTQILTQINNL